VVQPVADCVGFLQWALPRLGKRWPGYRKVRRQVCRRARRRAAELGLAGLGEYRAYLERHPEEWPALDALTCITISRFYRDRGVFDVLAADVVPALAAGGLRAWSAGCASGEEPYTLAILCELAGLDAEILATDIEPAMLRRARAACYSPGSLRELPEAWRRAAFDEQLCVRPRFRRAVAVERHDLRAPVPGGPFDLVLCRNSGFTYFDVDGQRELLRRLGAAVVPGGALVLGAHERLPGGEPGFEPWAESRGVFRRR
jgi:chemotaxis protein methyltransferase CheR